jgi:hypothetical protein
MCLVYLLMVRLPAVRHFCLLSPNFLTMYPVAFEAVLRAEVALLAQFLAVWTLQRAGVVLTICACTLSWGVCSHSGAACGLWEDVALGKFVYCSRWVTLSFKAIFTAKRLVCRAPRKRSGDCLRSSQHRRCVSELAPGLGPNRGRRRSVITKPQARAVRCTFPFGPVMHHRILILHPFFSLTI